MAGFDSISGSPDYVYADNASFDGTGRGGGLVTDGQLWIGNTATGRPTVGTLTSTGGTVTITPGAGTINLESTAVGFNCAFSAFLPSSDNNLTGDNTLAGLDGLTELYDLGSNFNPTTGTFTAPATGIYMFVMNMYLNGVGASHNNFGMRLYGNSPPFEYVVSNMNGQPIVINGENIGFNGSCMVQMTAGDTLVSAITVSGGARTVGFVGFNAGRPSYFTFFQGARIG